MVNTSKMQAAVRVSGGGLVAGSDGVTLERENTRQYTPAHVHAEYQTQISASPRASHQTASLYTRTYRSPHSVTRESSLVSPVY